MGIRSSFYAQMLHTINLVSTQKVNAPPTFAHNFSNWPMSTRKAIATAAMWPQAKISLSIWEMYRMWLFHSIFEQNAIVGIDKRRDELYNLSQACTHIYVEIYFYTHTVYTQNVAIWILDHVVLKQNYYVERSKNSFFFHRMGEKLFVLSFYLHSRIINIYLHCYRMTVFKQKQTE